MQWLVLAIANVLTGIYLDTAASLRNLTLKTSPSPLGRNCPNGGSFMALLFFAPSHVFTPERFQFSVL